MSCNKSEISDLLPLLIEGNLSEDESTMVMNHIASCPQCEKLYKDLREIDIILKNTHKNIKDNWVHPSPEDLTLYALSQDEISTEKKKEIETHLHWCKSCAHEIELIMESPALSIRSTDETIVPNDLMSAFKGKYHKNTDTEKSNNPTSFLDKIKMINLIPPKLSFTFNVALLIFTFSIGLISGHILVSNYIISKKQVSTPSTKKHYIQYPLDNVSNKDVDKILVHLQNEGFDVFKKNEKLWIRDDQIPKAFGYLVKYKKYNNTPLATAIKSKNSNKSTYENFFRKVASRGKFLLNQKKSTKDSIAKKDSKDYSKLGVIATRSSKKFGRFHSVHSTSPINSESFLLNVGNSVDAPVMHHEALTSVPGLLGADLNDRKMATDKIQSNFFKNITDILKKYRKITPYKLFVTISLDFQKDQHDNYPIRGIKITIKTRRKIKPQDKQKIKTEIRKSLKWNKSWDGEIKFTNNN